MIMLLNEYIDMYISIHRISTKNGYRSIVFFFDLFFRKLYRLIGFCTVNIFLTHFNPVQYRFFVSFYCSSLYSESYSYVQDVL